MTRIYLIRHAEPKAIFTALPMAMRRASSPTIAVPAQIRALAQRFRDIPVDAVYAVT